MPKTTGIIINTLDSVWFQFVGLFVILNSILIPDNFHIGFADVTQDPACVEVVLRQFFELLDSL